MILIFIEASHAIKGTFPISYLLPRLVKIKLRHWKCNKLCFQYSH